MTTSNTTNRRFGKGGAAALLIAIPCLLASWFAGLAAKAVLAAAAPLAGGSFFAQLAGAIPWVLGVALQVGSIGLFFAGLIPLFTAFLGFCLRAVSDR